MALNSSGPISIAGTTAGQSIQIELNGNGTTQMSLNDASVRTLAGVASGQIVMPTNFYGKSNTFLFNISSNQQQANLRTLALAAGWDGTAAVIATVNAGVYVWSDSTSSPGLTVDGSWPGGVAIVNNGFIIGKGGTGGGSGGTNLYAAPTAGGSALSFGVNVTITNNSYIAGGGGGGGGGGNQGNIYAASAGGGAGGGSGGPSLTTAGIGGSIGASGGNGGSVDNGSVYTSSGGGGGRILPGVGGAAVSGGTGAQRAAGLGGGAGGSGSTMVSQTSFCGGSTPRVAALTGAGGGGWGASGGTGYVFVFCGSGPGVTYTSGAGGSANNVGGNSTAAGTAAAGAVGGKAVALNGYSVTWINLGTVYGAVS
jgi:hypothetical protein